MDENFTGHVLDYMEIVDMKFHFDLLAQLRECTETYNPQVPVWL